MMWNNAGSFLAPRQESAAYAVASASASTSDHPSSEAEDVEFVVTTPVTTPCVLSIARRDQFFGSTLAAQESFFAERVVQAHDVQAPRFVHELQLFWKSYVKRVVDSSEKDMWRLFCSVRTETRVCQTAVLRAVRPMVDSLLLPRWPKDRRALDKKINKLGGFRSRIMRAVKIDMKDFGHDTVEFTFVDPIYAWASTALRISRSSPLHFQFCPLYDPDTHERLFGTSVKCGEVMNKSCARVKSR